MFFPVFICTFIFYLFSMYPTISPYRDSGDMIVSAFTLGIAHPPGYPLYVLLGKVFTILIPFGNIAYRVNLMSAFFGAAACGVIYLLIRKIGERILGGKESVLIFGSLFAVFKFSLSSSMHSLSIVSEMYSVNIFFAVLIIYLLLTACRLPIAAFLLGLGLGNHQTLVLLLPGIVYFLLAAGFNLRNERNLKVAATVLLFFLIGSSVYLFIPIRSAQNPVADWGSPAQSFRNFTRVLTRADYGAIRLHPEKSPSEQNFADVIKNFVNYLNISIEEKNGWAVVTVFFIISGIYLTFREKIFRTLFLCWFFSGPVFFIISNLPLTDKTSLPILEPYLIMPAVIITLFFAFGFLRGLLDLNKFVSDKIIIVVISAGMCGIILPGLPQLSKRHEFIAWDYSKDLLKTLPYNSVLFNPDDTTTFTLKYQQECLGKRKDIKLAIFYKTLWGYKQIRNRHPEILPDYEIKGGVELEKILPEYNFSRFPFYTDNIGKIPPRYKISPKGLLYGNSGIFEQMFGFYVNPRISGKERFFTHQIINYYSAGYNNLGLAFNEKKLYNKSIWFFERAIEIDPALSQAYNNLGVVYWAKGEYGRAADYFRKALNYAASDIGVKRNLEMAEEKLK